MTPESSKLLLSFYFQRLVWVSIGGFTEQLSGLEEILIFEFCDMWSIALFLLPSQLGL